MRPVRFKFMVLKMFSHLLKKIHNKNVMARLNPIRIPMKKKKASQQLSGSAGKGLKG